MKQKQYHSSTGEECCNEILFGIQSINRSTSGLLSSTNTKKTPGGNTNTVRHRYKLGGMLK